MPPPADVLAFARAALPGPPARVLEIGAGSGELARALADAGYDVTAIDPAATEGGTVKPVALLDVPVPEAPFDAALAVLSLHHVEPLDASCAHLARLVRPGGVLAVDEFDIEAFDERAAGWWVAQRGALGRHAPAVEDLRSDLAAHVHPLRDVAAALAPWFALGEPVRGPYLHRFELHPALRSLEEALIAEGAIPAVGARLAALRRPAP